MSGTEATNMKQRANKLTKELTAFASFDAMVQSSLDHRYVPTLRGWSEETEAAAAELADYYDQAMAKAGSDKKAFRGTSF